MFIIRTVVPYMDSNKLINENVSILLTNNLTVQLCQQTIVIDDDYHFTQFSRLSRTKQLIAFCFFQSFIKHREDWDCDNLQAISCRQSGILNLSQALLAQGQLFSHQEDYSIQDILKHLEPIIYSFKKFPSYEDSNFLLYINFIYLNWLFFY